MSESKVFGKTGSEIVTALRELILNEGSEVAFGFSYADCKHSPSEWSLVEPDTSAPEYSPAKDGPIICQLECKCGVRLYVNEDKTGTGIIKRALDEQAIRVGSPVNRADGSCEGCGMDHPGTSCDECEVPMCYGCRTDTNTLCDSCKNEREEEPTKQHSRHGYKSLKRIGSQQQDRFLVAVLVEPKPGGCDGTMELYAECELTKFRRHNGAEPREILCHCLKEENAREKVWDISCPDCRGRGLRITTANPEGRFDAVLGLVEVTEFDKSRSEQLGFPAFPRRASSGETLAALVVDGEWIPNDPFYIGPILADYTDRMAVIMELIDLNSAKQAIKNRAGATEKAFNATSAKEDTATAVEGIARILQTYGDV